MYDFSLFYQKMFFVLKLERFKKIIAFCRFIKCTSPHHMPWERVIQYFFTFHAKTKDTKKKKIPKKH